MHLHILGICGTFMGGLAALAREAGHRATGCDANVYPPMSDQLRALGIELIEGYGDDQLKLAPDVFVIGNVVTRGNPLMEAILDVGARYASGRQWLAEHVLHMAVGRNDTFLANHLGNHEAEATAAVGTVGYIFWFLGLFAGAIGTGSTAIIAREVGARHRRRANSACGGRSLTRAAASSMASGNPSSRRQIAATVSAFMVVSVKPGLTSWAR